MENELIVNKINEYETKFNGALKRIYKNEIEFINDLNNEIETNGVNEIVQYYKTYSKSMNDANSTNEKQIAIMNLISLLENK